MNDILGVVVIGRVILDCQGLGRGDVGCIRCFRAGGLVEAGLDCLDFTILAWWAYH